MAFSAVADARRFMADKRKFDVEADCSRCQRHCRCWSPDRAGLNLCADCLAYLDAEKVINLQVASYGKIIDEAIIGIRYRDEKKIVRALNASEDVWARLMVSPRIFAIEGLIGTMFADSILHQEFEIEDAAQKFSAGLRRHMKRRRKTFDECLAIIWKWMRSLRR
jgi:hypothetical protein